MYDVDGVLVRTAVNGVGTDYLVDTSGGLSHVVAEVDSSSAVAVLYVRAGDMLLEEVRGGVAKMYEADGLGSVRGLLDVSGAKTDAYSYEAFGSTLSSTGSDANPYRFAGERLVESAGMYQNRARWLDTRTGRFVSVDPACPDGECHPSRLHRYVYAGADPVDMVDASGEDFTLAGLVIGVEMMQTIGAVSQPGVAGTITATRRGPNFTELLGSQYIGGLMRAFLARTGIRTIPTVKGRHEEGGWLYMKKEVVMPVAIKEPEFRMIPAKAGPPCTSRGCGINLNHPILLPGFVIVATCHAHPVTLADIAGDGWPHGPSEDDRTLSKRDHRVPGLIIDDVGMVPFGPEYRRRLDNGDAFPTSP